MTEPTHKTDISDRIKLIFQHPRKVSNGEKPMIIAVTVPWLIANGRPLTEKGKPWVYQSIELIH